MKHVPSDWVGSIRAGLKPRVFPCGHVQLIDGPGYINTVVDFDTARKYLAELTAQMNEAERLAREQHGPKDQSAERKRVDEGT